MASIIQQQQDLEYFPDENLINEASQPSGRFPGYLVIAELERRQEFRDRYNASQQAQQGEQPTIAEQAVDEYASGIVSADPNFQGQAQPAASPMMQMAQQPMPQQSMPQPTMQMAGGGKVPRYQAGSTISIPPYRPGLFIPPGPNPATGKPWTAEEAEELERLRRSQGPRAALVAPVAPGLLSAEEIAERAKEVDFGVTDEELEAAFPSGQSQAQTNALEAAQDRIDRSNAQLDPSDPTSLASLFNDAALRLKTPDEYEVALKAYMASLNPESKDAGIALLKEYRPDREKTSSRKQSSMLQGLGRLVLNLGHNNEEAFQAMPDSTREIENIEDKYKDDAFKVDSAILQRREDRQDKLLDATAKLAGLENARELKGFENARDREMVKLAQEAGIRGDTGEQLRIRKEIQESNQRRIQTVLDLKQAGLNHVVQTVTAVTNRMNAIVQGEIAINQAQANSLKRDSLAIDALIERIAILSELTAGGGTEKNKAEIKKLNDQLQTILKRYIGQAIDPNKKDPANLGI